ncbi:MAG: hypothetical protein ACFFDE_10610 [Promethearchaeota archaeon]
MIWAEPPHTPPPYPDTLSSWPSRFRLIVFIVFILCILILLAVVSGQIAWLVVLFIISFVILLLGFVWIWTHPKENENTPMVRRIE